MERKKLGRLEGVTGGPYGSLVKGPDGWIRLYASGDGGMHLYVSANMHKWEDRGLVLQNAYEGSIFWDPLEKEYKALYSLCGYGLAIAHSRDGLGWSDFGPPLLKYGFDSNNACVVDEKREQYVLFLRSWDLNPGLVDKGNLWTRKVTRLAIPSLEAKDGIWSCSGLRGRDLGKASPFRDPEELPPWVLPEFPSYTIGESGELPLQSNEDLYTWSPCLIDGLWWAFPSVYQHDPGETDPLSEGRIEIHAAGSHDGLFWRWFLRPEMETGGTQKENLIRGTHVWIPRGLPTDVDCGCLYAYTGAIRLDDSLYQVYYGSNMTHTKRKVLQVGADGVEVDRRGGLFLHVTNPSIAAKVRPDQDRMGS